VNRTVRVAAAGAVVLAALVGAGVRAAATSAGGATPVLGPGPVTVDLRIEHSRFVPDRVLVRPGTLVTFRVRNRDPIGHELIVGGPDVHRRHESGHEAFHPPVPGEVSVPAGTTAATTLPIEDTVVFACHLPGHLAYGMRGRVEVVRG
jgi:plastocyanin